MTFAVPFDGSKLAEAALVRADEYARALNESVVVLSVISTGPHYAIRKGWVDSREAFDIETAARGLRERARELVPDADFEYRLVGPRPPAGAIAKTLRNMLRSESPSVVFIGSDNAGRIARPVSSVSTTVASGKAYDVYLVRDPKPSEIAALDGHKSFYD